MKKLFEEFKKFITRGNVIDLAVGVIIGSAFSSIVTSLTDKIIMPFINWLLALGGNGLDSAYTFLKKVYDADNNIDLTNSIYIDWGAFITAVINFFLIALVLFTIIKIASKSRDVLHEMAETSNKYRLTKEDRKELIKRGVNIKDRAAVRLELDKMAEEEKARKEAEAKANYKPTTNELLTEIVTILKEKDNE